MLMRGRLTLRSAGGIPTSLYKCAEFSPQCHIIPSTSTLHAVCIAVSASVPTLQQLSQEDLGFTIDVPLSLHVKIGSQYP